MIKKKTTDIRTNSFFSCLFAFKSLWVLKLILILHLVYTLKQSTSNKKVHPIYFSIFLPLILKCWALSQLRFLYLVAHLKLKSDVYSALHSALSFFPLLTFFVLKWIDFLIVVFSWIWIREYIYLCQSDRKALALLNEHFYIQVMYVHKKTFKRWRRRGLIWELKGLQRGKEVK